MIQDILNILLIAGILVIVGCALFTTYYLIRALKSIRQLSDALEQTTQNVKDTIQLKIVSAIPAFLAGFLSRIFKKKEVNK